MKNFQAPTSGLRRSFNVPTRGLGAVPRLPMYPGFLRLWFLGGFALLGLHLAVLAVSAQPAMRFSLKPELLSFADCVAQPGSVAVPLSPTNANLEIVNWSTAPVPANRPGEFVLRFKAPVSVATVIAYDPGQILFAVGGQWNPATDGGSRRGLQVVPFPAGASVEAVKFVVPAAGSDAERAGRLFSATLSFVTLIPLRAVNVAPDAQVTASSTGSANAPETLVDGLVDGRRNFATARRATPATPEAPDWVTLAWDEPRTFRGIFLMRGSEDAGFGQLRVDTSAGGNADAGAAASIHWEPHVTRATVPGRFRANQLVVTPQPMTTRALRLANIGTTDQIGLGEVAVLSDLGDAPAPARAAEVRSRTWLVPKVRNGQIKPDGVADDWPAGRTNGFALAYDDQRLYVLYQTEGAAAAFANPGTNQNELFYSGDALDLMLQTRSDADPRRTGPGPGDVRLVFTLFEKKPVCAFYDYRVDDLLVVPVVFKSAGREVSCERVTLLPDAEVRVRREEGRLVIEAGVPFAAIHFDPKSVRETRGDLGRVFGRPGGAGMTRYERWSDPRSREIRDIVEAADLQPREWGIMRFAGDVTP